MTASFKAYWQAVDEELAATPANPWSEPLPERSSPGRYRSYRVRLTGIGPHRLLGYLSVPEGPGPHPALLITPRYGSVVEPAPHQDRLRYVTLVLVHRGQRHTEHPFVAPYPGLLTLGVEDPATYVFRALVADVVRGAEVLVSRPEVDRSRVAVRGGDLALLAAARRPGLFQFAVAQDLLLYRALEARALAGGGYPLQEWNDVVRAHPEAVDAIAGTLALFDPLRHAPSIKARTLLAVGDDGAPAGEDFLRPLLAALGERGEPDRLTHLGAVDHNRQDAWLARRLGARAMTRFRYEEG